MLKPVFILTPGTWHAASAYSKIVPLVEAQGHRVILHDWPSVKQAPVTSFDGDIYAICTAVIKAADAGNDIVVVAHSWSGSPVNSAVSDLSKAERTKRGEKGGIIKLVYLCAFIVPSGVSLLGALGSDETKIPSWNVQGDLLYVNDPAHYFYLDLPKEEQDRWVSQLKPHAKATACLSTTGAAYMTIPSHYLICETDNAIPSFVQEAMVKQAQDAGAPMQVERIKCGHSPFLSHPQ